MLLEGKKGLVLNITNKNSIGWAVAQLAADHGARVGVGAQNERMMESVLQLVDGDERFVPVMVDFGDEDQLDALAETSASTFGTLDFVVHSAAFAPREELAGRFIDTSREGFGIALDVSAYSLVRLCNKLEKVLADDASIVTMSYLGSTRAVGNYNVMGIAKAALEASVRYLAVDLGGRGIRVNTVSPGPINTVAARGVKGLTEMIEYVRGRAPLKRDAAQSEVAGTTIALLSDLTRGVTGQIVFVDAGYNIVGL
ncbi:MAG: enoyl-ACP reductase [Fimbriimonadaceae bacterium]|nr:enoyl-ACP reductase [Chthonomonadaceae bacterium]MCO5295626.1 enoyl-ACP reductase [Fimbriimonadaceae bacterium]